MIFSKNEQEFIVKQMRRVGIEVYAATDQLVTCKGSQWERYAIAVAKASECDGRSPPTADRGNQLPFPARSGDVDVHRFPHRITFMRHNKIEKRFERLRVRM